MISSVVATLNTDTELQGQTVQEIASYSGIKIGTPNADGRRIPVTIESHSRRGVENATEWLRTREGVLMVDVIFVHFEDDDETVDSQH